MFTLGQAIAAILRRYGCEEIYGIGGDYVAPLIRALHGQIELCPSASETNASYAACGSAEIHGLGCVLTTYMVGSIPALAGAALAVAERLPVVFISGAPGFTESSERVALHHSLSHADRVEYHHALSAFRALGMRAERLSDSVQFEDLVQYAVSHSQPVFVEVPRDLVIKSQPAFDVTPQEPASLAPWHLLAAEANELEMRLRQARKPLVYFGDDLRRNKIGQQVVLEFCRELQIPFASDACAKGVYCDSEPLNLGVYNGVFSNDSTARYVDEEVDFVIELGTSEIPKDICVSFKSNTHSVRTHRNRLHIPIHQLHALNMVRQRWTHGALDFVPVPARAPDTIFDAAAIGLYSLPLTLTEFQQRSSRPVLYLPEIGSAFFASLGLPAHRNEIGPGWLANPWYGAMGTSLPYARAVARAIKKRKSKVIPIVLIGDGGLQMQVNELAHFQREELGAIIILLRNNQYAFGRACDDPIYESCSAEFDAKRMIQAYGGWGVSVFDAGGLKRALDDYSQGVMLVEVMAHPRQEHKFVSMIEGMIKTNATGV